jgi:hypothetical protein
MVDQIHYTVIYKERLEINVVRHCNNRCAACAHAAPWAEEFTMPPAVMERDLAVLSHLFHVEHLWLTGGEPLLHPQLTEMARIARASGVGDKVCVQSNGRLIDRADDSFMQHVDLFAISVYPTLEPHLVEVARQKCVRHGIQLGGRPFSTFLKVYHNDPDARSFYGCTVKRIVFTANLGWFFRCPQSALFPGRFMGLEPSADGISIDDHLSEQSLAGFIENESCPLKTCAICDPQREEVEWHECATLAEWIKDSTLQTA